MSESIQHAATAATPLSWPQATPGERDDLRPVAACPDVSYVEKGQCCAMRVDKVKLGTRHRHDMGDIEALAASIADVGLLHDIVVTKDDVLVAGSRRLAAVKLLGWGDVPVKVVDLESIVKGEWTENAMRKDFTPTEAVAIARAAEPLAKVKAAERKAATQGNKQTGVGKFPAPEKGRAADELGSLVGTSGKTLQKATAVVEAAEADPAVFSDLTEQMDATGKIDKAYKEMRRRQRPEAPKPGKTTKSPRLIVGKAGTMPEVKTESVDIIITSPPYNLGAEDWPMGGEGRKPREEGIGYQDAIPEPDYQAWQVACLQEMFRVAKAGASLFYNVKARQFKGEMIHPMDWLRHARNPWTLRQEIVWDRGSTHNHAAQLFWPEDERVYWLTKGKPTLPDRPIGMSTVWRFHGPVADTWHPAPFPEELPRRCLQALGRQGIVVLDPFAGSCTTLNVALEMGYDAVGIDMSQEYIRQAQEEYGWTSSSRSVGCRRCNELR